MPGQTPISNLQQLNDWLATLSVGNNVSVSSTLFSDQGATQVIQALTLLPGGPIDLKITALAAPVLTGTATILGEADTALVFTFAADPANGLTLALNITPPASLSWKLINQLDLSFGSLSSSLAPNEDVNATTMSFAASLQASTISFPVQLTVPSFDGDWTLLSTDIPAGQLTDSALKALLGGQDLLGILPADLAKLDKLSITRFEAAFSVAKQTCSMLRLSMSYKGDWKFFNDRFVVKSINFDVDVYSPFTKEMTFDAKLYAQMALPPLPLFDVGGQFPNPSVFVQLSPGQVLKLSDTLNFFGVPIPENMPDVEVSSLGFTLYPPFESTPAQFQFHIAITKPVVLFTLPGGATTQLNTFTFDVGVTAGTGTSIEVTGGLYAAFEVSATTLILSGAYSTTGGLDITGEAYNIPLGSLLTDLAAKFGIDPNDVPPAIREHLKMDWLQVNLNTGAKTFDFTCVGSTEISGVGVEFAPSIHIGYGSTTADMSFGGQLALQYTEDDGATRKLLFNLTFSKTAADTWMDASFVADGKPIGFGDLAKVFGFTPPTIPSDLDLGLKEVRFRYDFTKQALTFALQSANYGSAVFLRLPLTTSAAATTLFLLNSGQTFSLSNLPLVGQQLAQIEDMSVSDLLVVIGSADQLTEANATTINAQIDSLKATGYPHVPPKGIKGKLLLSASLNFGKEKFPLAIALGGNSTKSTEALPTRLSLADGSTSAALQGEVLAASNGNDDGTTWFSIQKSFGPVTFGRIGVLFQSKTQTLWFALDASLTVGPMTLSLMDLGIGSQLKTFSPQFNLQGLGIAYNAPPLTIAGALINLQPPGSTDLEFAGGVIIGTSSFTLQAYGYYGNVDNFTSLFLFGALAYPFGGPPAFFVTGASLGFGYNSAIHIPHVDQVQVFPFVQAVSNPSYFGPNPTPAAVLGKMLDADPKVPGSPWVQRQQGSLWFSAGITFTSFSLINANAMLFIEIGPDLVIALIGVAYSQFPQKVPGVTNAPVYAYIELDMELRFSPTEGVFSLEAVLASSSFLLDRACVLTGGFAFYVWFPPSTHTGDFVVSLGGYHAGFHPPAYYPTVPRVGFHWSLDSSISISGGTYFAFTPAALMVGGELNATYQAGNLKAWFDAHADIIIRWKPFWFNASFGITIGASYTMDLLFTDATFTIELGVDLELWGPPTGGKVHVDWYIISFTIPFGAGIDSGNQVKGWDDGVQAMLPNTGTDAKPNVLKLAPTAGLSPSGTSPGTARSRMRALQASAPADAADGGPWTVRGSQFGFTVGTPIPATTITVGGAHAVQGSKFNVFPLGWKDVSSTAHITIQDAGGEDYSAKFEATPSIDGVPQALWGSPPQTPDGKPQVPDGKNLLVPNQTTGISLQVVAPVLGYSPGIILFSTLPGDNLSLPNALLPLSPDAQPVGDVPQQSDTTVGLIADKAKGIAATDTIASRNAIFAALQALQLAPDTTNDSMQKFADKVGCALAQEPLLVSASTAPHRSAA